MSNKNRYLLYGCLFGIVFPVFAFLLRYFEYGYEKAVGLFYSDPLLWIIASAPVFLGALAYFAGKKQDEVEEKIRIVNESESKLKEANQKINETLEKLQREHAELIKSRETNKEFEKLEEAIKIFKNILLEIGNYNFTVRIDGKKEAFGKHGKELAGILCNTIDNLRKVIMEEMESIRITITASSEILEATEKISNNLQLQSNNIYQVNSDVSTFNKVIDENNRRVKNVLDCTGDVYQNLNRLGEIFQVTTKGMEEITDSVNNSKKIIEDLYKSSEQIDAIIKVINDIAQQTNLLALNAAIEAARAGEHGRGFAVVADEVKKLADRTQVATGEIENTIQKIQHDVQIAVKSAINGNEKTKVGRESVNEANKFLQEIIDKMNRVSANVSELAQATEEQAETSSHIQEQTENILQVVESNKVNVTNIVEVAQTLNSMVLQVEEIMRKFKLEGISQSNTVFALYDELQV